MMDVMYEIPSDDNIGKCRITKEVVEGEGDPILTYRTDEVNTYYSKMKPAGA
jgi:ATP-dependent Clp protease ATP-binding subunit ClpX